MHAKGSVQEKNGMFKSIFMHQINKNSIKSPGYLPTITLISKSVKMEALHKSV